MTGRNFISLKSPAAAFMLLAAVVVSVLYGCERRPLLDPEYGVKLRMEIVTDAVKNVTEDIYNKDISRQEIVPDMMHILLYDESGERIISEQYVDDTEVNEDGNTVFKAVFGVLPGRYRILGYSFGTAGEKPIALEVRDWHKAADAYASSSLVPEKISTKYKSKGSEHEDVIYEPEHLMVVSETVDIPYHEEVYTVEAEARTVIESWYLQVRVDGMQWVSGVQAFLSGMASANFIADDRRVEDPMVTVYFPLEKGLDGETEVLCAVFNTFGRVPDSVNDLNIVLNLQTVDGKNQRWEKDISYLFDTEEARLHHWLLLDEVITVEKPEVEGGGGGFDPSVGDWEEEEKEIIL